MCVEAVVYVLNRIPSSVLANKAPYELLYKHEPNLSHLRVIGCDCYTTNLVKHDKFSPRSTRSVLLGYSSHQKGYKLLDLKTLTIFVSRDVSFNETIFPFQHQNNLREQQSNYFAPVDQLIHPETPLMEAQDLEHSHSVDPHNGTPQGSSPLPEVIAEPHSAGIQLEAVNSIDTEAVVILSNFR